MTPYFRSFSEKKEIKGWGSINENDYPPKHTILLPKSPTTEVHWINFNLVGVEREEEREGAGWEGDSEGEGRGRCGYAVVVATS